MHPPLLSSLRPTIPVPIRIRPFVLVYSLVATLLLCPLAVYAGTYSSPAYSGGYVGGLNPLDETPS